MPSHWKPLHPFTKTAKTEGITLEAKAESTSEGIRIAYRLKSPALAAQMRIDGKTPGTRRDELWKTTCFEAFLGVKSTSSYFEFNAAPSGDWAWYAFEDYRKGMTKPELGEAPRELSRKVDGDSFEFEWFIPNAALASKEMYGLSLTAVLDQGGELTYWALAHKGAEPDFHRRDSFVY